MTVLLYPVFFGESGENPKTVKDIRFPFLNDILITVCLPVFFFEPDKIFFLKNFCLKKESKIYYQKKT